MERVKLLIAIGLCVALMMLPLAGMAGNPLPVTNNADGHPWDDGDITHQPGDPGDTLDTLIDITKCSAVGKFDDKPGKSAFCFTIVWKWYLVLIW